MLTEQFLYPYPHPKSIGLVLDPDQRARVQAVKDSSPAKSAGLRAGDEILRMNGQPLISMADVQWVLHHLSADGGVVNLQVRRGEKTSAMSLTLPDGWRRNDDTSWRTGHWILRRTMLGGMKLSQVKEGDNEIEVEIAEGVKVRVVKSTIAQVLSKTEPVEKS